FHPERSRASAGSDDHDAVPMASPLPIHAQKPPAGQASGGNGHAVDANGPARALLVTWVRVRHRRRHHSRAAGHRAGAVPGKPHQRPPHGDLAEGVGAIAGDYGPTDTSITRNLVRSAETVTFRSQCEAPAPPWSS